MKLSWSAPTPTALSLRPSRPAGPVPASSLILVLTLTLALLPGLLAGRAAASPVDPWPTYHPQTRCSPTPKPGTVKLADWLQRRYPGSGSLGISRSCSSGGTSEHKEGRAFDWALDATSRRDRHYATAFLHRALATDAHGNAAALARRMGIMYMIWNDHIYSATYHYAKRPYLNAGCSRIATCSPTLRHRDHMHISLTWPGALAQTSWYRKPHTAAPHPPAPHHNPPPAPHQPAHHHFPNPHPDPTPPPTHPHEPDPGTHGPGGPGGDGPVLDVSDGRTMTVHVDGDGDPTSPRPVLAAGKAYKLTVYGLYRYGPAAQAVTDAACVWSPSRKEFVGDPGGRIAHTYGSLDLLVNNKDVFDSTCDTRRHAYSTRYVPKHTQRLRLRVANRYRDADNRALTVIVSAPGTPVHDLVPPPVHAAAAPTAHGVEDDGSLALSDDVRVEADSEGTYSTRVLQAGVRYRITTSGVASLGDGVYTDGQCVADGGVWARHRSLDLNAPDADHGALFVDGVEFSGPAPAEDSTGCSAHVHTMTYVPTRTSRVWFSVWDPFDRSDDEGDLEVRIDRLGPITAPPAAAAETPGSSRAWTSPYDRVNVSAGDVDGVTTTLRFKKGEKVRLYVRGAYGTGETYADAGCVWRQDAWTPEPAANGQDVLHVYVDGQPVDWRPWRGSDACDENHEYTTTVTATKDGPLSLAVFDLDYRDNRGSVTVLAMRN